MTELILFSIVISIIFFGYEYLKDKFLEKNKTPFHNRLKIK